MIRCPLCSYEFSPAGLNCHSHCPLHGHCHLICCPNCGYQFVDVARSRLAGWLGRLLPAAKKVKTPAHCVAPNNTVPLAQSPVGTPASVIGFDGLPARLLARFSVLGLVPGAEVTLLQSRPAPVVRIGETEVAIGADIATRIHVRMRSG